MKPRRYPAAIVVLATVATAAALYLARELFIPVALALLFTALLRPVVRALALARIPAPAGATLMVLGLLALLTAGGIFLSRPVQEWAGRAPQSLATARAKVDKLRRPVQRVTQAVAQIQREAAGAGDPRGSPPAAPATLQAPGLLAHVFGTTTTLLGGLLETLVLLFLVLATGDLLPRKLAGVLPSPVHATPEQLVEEVEGVVRRYVVATVLINAGQAVLVGVVMQLIGLSDPLLWGLLTFTLEFLPYIGAAFMIGFLTIVSFATFDGLGHIVLAPSAYFAITTIQNNVISPFAYGSRLRLNPIAVLLGVLVWWFLWGVAGAFVAVPLLATVKIFADHSRGWTRLGIVLGE